MPCTCSTTDRPLIGAGAPDGRIDVERRLRFVGWRGKPWMLRVAKNAPACGKACAYRALAKRKTASPGMLSTRPPDGIARSPADGDGAVLKALLRRLTALGCFAERAISVPFRHGHRHRQHPGLLRLMSLRSVHRQADGHRGALTRHAFDGHRAFVQRHQALDQRKAEASPLNRRV